MRINKYIASATGLSRRKADQAVAEGRVLINGSAAQTGQNVTETDDIRLDGQKLERQEVKQTILLNKPRGVVVSRSGQGSKTIYNLLPPELHHLKPVGRLDKDSSGLLLLTNDGHLAQELTHPKYQKTKVYEVELDKPLTPRHFKQITETGVDIGDKSPSKFDLVASSKQQVVNKEAAKHPCYFLPATCYWRATLAEGRNRQIRRTFAALGYKVTKLHRTQFGRHQLHDLPLGRSKGLLF